jgi:hypothetical protein
MNIELIYKLLKYLVQGIIIFLLFKYAPKDPMSDKDNLLITTIVILACAVFENFYNIYISHENSCKSSNTLHDTLDSNQCSSYCSLNNTEHLTNLSMSPDNSSKPITSVQPTKVVINNTATRPPTVAMPTPAVTTKMPTPAVTTTMPTPTVTMPTPTVTMPTMTSTTNMQEENNNKIKQLNTAELKGLANEVITALVDQGITKQADGSYIIKPVINKQAPATGSRLNDGVLKDESKFSYIDFNSIPQTTNTGSFEYGYSFLPPAQWYPVPAHPPVCVSDQKCPVCPVYTTGTNVELKEWDNSRRIMPPDEINVNAIEQKLNSGR